MKLCICGLGYVGSVTAACLAKAGHTVCGVDTNEEKVRMIREGVSPVIEEGLTLLVQETVQAGRLTATADLEGALSQAEATLVAVGTPSRPNGSLDTTALERVCEAIGRTLRKLGKAQTVIIRSTILPGTCRELLIPILETTAGRKCDDSFGVVYNPEFMREGTSVADFHTPPFTVIGQDNGRHGSLAAMLYATVSAPLERTTIEVSELLKYSCNAFHALKITFANEIGVFAAAHGVNSREVMRLLCLDHKLNISPAYLRPGFAFGGSCLPKDLRAILHRAKQADLQLPLLAAILPSNNQQVQRGLELVYQAGKTNVGLLGLTFKNGTDDLRESPFVELAETLIGKGYKLRIHDDNVSLARLVGANAAYLNKRLPHITNLLAPLEEVVQHGEVLVVCNNTPQYFQVLSHLRPEQRAIDLAGMPSLNGTASQVKGVAW